MTAIIGISAPLAASGLLVLLVLRPWAARRDQQRHLQQRARIEGRHEACSITGDEATRWEGITREYRHLGRKVRQ
jgi:hypothetical protein